MKRKSKPRIGRPPHTDDPPQLFSTTIPESVYGLLRELSEKQNRPKSEILSDALRAYARRSGIS
jgi:hypothetical protein